MCGPQNPYPARVAAKLLSQASIDRWQVFVAVETGEIAISRAFFPVADDGVVDKASTSTLPDELASTFAARFANRVRGGNAPRR